MTPSVDLTHAVAEASKTVGTRRGGHQLSGNALVPLVSLSKLSSLTTMERAVVIYRRTSEHPPPPSSLSKPLPPPGRQQAPPSVRDPLPPLSQLRGQARPQSSLLLQGAAMARLPASQSVIRPNSQSVSRLMVGRPLASSPPPTLPTSIPPSLSQTLVLRPSSLRPLESQPLPPSLHRSCVPLAGASAAPA